MQGAPSTSESLGSGTVYVGHDAEIGQQRRDGAQRGNSTIGVGMGVAHNPSL